jgi:hypothetical protein
VVSSTDAIVPRTLTDRGSNETSRTSAATKADPVPIRVSGTVLLESPSSSPASIAVSQVCGAAGQSSAPPPPAAATRPRGREEQRAHRK